jgi:hypothetical protein
MGFYQYIVNPAGLGVFRAFGFASAPEFDTSPEHH